MALQALRDHSQLRAGQRIAITGATGGVGSFAVQIAKAYGGHVTAVCRAENVELGRGSSGPTVSSIARATTICARNGTTRSSTTAVVGRCARCVVRSTPGGFVVLNCGQDISLMVAGHAARLILRRRDVKQFVRKVTRPRLLELAALVQDGSVTPLVDRTYQLAETMRYLMARHPRRQAGRDPVGGWRVARRPTNPAPTWSLVWRSWPKLARSRSVVRAKILRLTETRGWRMWPASSEARR
jgi:D-arabinose 1-dehydrogenase-like Zn-dependent alcohol dehydrogenase